MFEKNINSSAKAPRILVAPLDWGLGHATRCIPIIRELKNLGCEVLVAGETAVAALLQQEFPGIEVLPLEGYRIRYSKKGSGLVFSLAMQLPGLIRSIRNENRWLQRITAVKKIDAVISDNRFGLHHPSIPTSYITHQLQIQSGFRLTDVILKKLHLSIIKRFGACWVPDFPGDINLAGRLSHTATGGLHPHMIGAVSRLEKLAAGNGHKHDLLVLISGPEPQRSLFESTILEQLEGFNGSVLVLRGRPGATKEDIPQIKNHRVTILNHLPAAALAAEMNFANWIICRSGYTTVMDLVKLRRQAILVPTPAQTEQEYLARYLEQQGYFYTVPQKDFLLTTALQAAQKKNMIPPAFDMDRYRSFVQQFVETLKKNIISK